MAFNWKQSLASAGSIFLGIILANLGSGDVPTTWEFWKHTLWYASTTTLLAEARYIYAWLSTVGAEQPVPPPPTPGGK